MLVCTVRRDKNMPRAMSRVESPLATRAAILTSVGVRACESVLLARRPVREVGGYPGLVQVVGLTARLGGRNRALVIREPEMRQHAPDRLLVTVRAAQLLVDDLVRRQPELVVQLAPAGLALGE
jgi:hypothetical protein